MAKSTKGVFVQSITVIDPDSLSEVEIDIYKLEGGGMVGIDASFFETDEPIYSPFDKNIEIDFED